MKITTFLLLILVPFSVAIAAPEGFVSSADPQNIIKNILDFVATLFLFGAVIFFVYSGYLYLSSGGDSKKQEAAKQNFLWGCVGVAVGLLAYVFPEIVKSFLESGF